MAGELQRIVEAVAERLHRAGAIDDPRCRLLAYSPHYGEVDDTRLESILHREAPAESVAWVLSQGIERADGPVRLPGNPALGLLPRVVAPIRCQGVHLGYLFLIDADQSLTDEDLAVAAAAADEAGLVLYRERLLAELERGRERELLRDLLDDDPAVRTQAVAALDPTLFAVGQPVCALVLRPLDSATGDGSLRLAIDTALGQVRRSVAPRHSLSLSRPDHGVFVLATPRRGAERSVDAVAHALITASEPALRGAETQAVVGIGELGDDLGAVRDSYRQARQAAQVAQVVRSFGSITHWAELGVYRTLARLPADELTASALHPGLVTLLDADVDGTLVRTLEEYLDRAGDAQATAGALVIHRTTLYYRLSRIEEIAGLSLRDGEARLALHLGLKMARLAGLHPGVSTRAVRSAS